LIGKISLINTNFCSVIPFEVVLLEHCKIA